jgi:4-diphosphocytidyl-2-C-methyl-D-erythritol kinase
VGDVKAIMLEYGAEGTMMSGSGPSAFGVFKSVESAKAAVDALKKRGYFASVAFPTTKRKL